MDCEPTLLGTGNVRVAVADGEETDRQERGVSKEKGSKERGSEGELWVRPIVSADHPALKSQAKRIPGISLGIYEDLKRNKV